MASEEFLIKYGSNFNRPNKQISYSTSEIVDVSQIDTYLSNNGSRFNEEKGFIQDGSIGILKDSENMYVCMFDETAGDENTEYNRRNGLWRCLCVKKWVTS